MEIDPPIEKPGFGSRAKAEKPVRFQVDFSARMAREIDQFEQESELTTHKEFFANAVALWRWAAQKSREGKIIAAIEFGEDGLDYVELSMPALDAVRCSAQLGENLHDQETKSYELS